MTEIISFFSPNVTSGLYQGLLTSFNILCVLGTGFLLRFFLRGCLKKRNPKFRETPAKAFMLLTVSFSVIVLFCALYIWQGRGTGNFLNFFWSVLDPILSISTMQSSPFPYLSGLNLTIRIVMLCALLIVTWFCYQTAEIAGTKFGVFLKNKENQLTAHKTTSADKASSQAQEHDKSSDSVIHDLIKASPLLGFLAMIFSYVLGNNDTQDAVVEILDAIRSLLDTITLTANLETGTGNIAVFFSNFLYVVLSICILAVYGTIIILLSMFLGAAVKHRGKIVKWVFDTRKVIWHWIAVILLLVVAGTFVFALSTGFESLRATFQAIFESGPVDLVHIALVFLLLVLLFNFVILMLGFAVVFVIFIANFGYQIVKRGIVVLHNSDRILQYARGITLLIAGIGFTLCVILGYGPVKNSLESLFVGGQEGSHTMLWVLGHILLLYIQALGFLVIVLLLFVAAEKLLNNIYGFLRNSGTGHSLIRSIAFQCIRLCNVIPLVLGQVYEVAKSSISTLMRIFIGYSTESQKNQAIFLAACFASLASLLNTFFGLIDFYKSDTSLIPVICSFAIACSVQMAMLIFGMKGGEAIAENMLSDQLRFGKDYTRLLISKVFYCLIYLFVYLTATAVIFLGGIVNNWGFHFDAVLPVILFLMASAAFAYGTIVQIMDIRKLWKARRTSVSKEPSFILPKEEKEYPSKRLRHLPPRFYLTGYFLLMIVSTGFAFNNLFGYYAQQAHLHQQVFDQVRSEANRQLDINGQVTSLVSQYYNNIDKILEALDNRVAAATEKRESDLAALRANVSSFPGEEYIYERARAENLLGQYIGNTADFQNAYSALKTYLKMDYDRLGEEVKITVETYNHYWGGNPQPSYQNGCIIIETNEDTSSNVGNSIPHEETDLIQEIVIDGVEYQLENRYKDPDSIDQQSISVMSRVIEQGDKYTVLEEILSFFEAQERIILDYDVEQTLSQNGGDQNTSENGGENLITVASSNSEENLSDNIDVRSLLDQNAIIDGIRGSLAQLYWEESSDEKPTETKQGSETGLNQWIVSIDDLPRIVDHYLEYGYESPQAEDNDILTMSQQQSATDKDAEYQNLDGYIDRMLQINNILSSEEAISTLNENKKAATDTEDSNVVEADKSYAVRRYRNYAQGIVYSNFQISYDALLRGGMGLNENAETLNALYHSTTVAMFILLICALVDLMAFFMGLLLFKDVFLFGHNEELENLGYLNYETALTNLFRVPSGGKERKLHLALIYRLLYGDNTTQYSDKNQVFTSEIMQSADFYAMFKETRKVLERLDLCDSHMADLRLWLLSYVEKNDISFDELFS